MSLNFFKTKTEKTDDSLDYKSIIDNLHTMDTALPSLDIDQFVQNENILLGKHQDYYNERKYDPKAIPKKLEKDTQYSADGSTRALVNSFIQLSKTMPEIKSNAAECNNQVESLMLQNNQTMDEINRASADLLK